MRLTSLGAGCGVLFIAIKAYEWSSEIYEGHTLGGSEFFSFCYVPTGVHPFHVLLGVLMMGIVMRELRNPRKRRLSMACCT